MRFIELIKALIELWTLATIDGTEYGITQKEAKRNHLKGGKY